MFRPLVRIGGLMALVGVIVGLGCGGWQYTRAKYIRQSLYDAFEPVAVTNCELKRFGDANPDLGLFNRARRKQLSLLFRTHGMRIADRI